MFYVMVLTDKGWVISAVCETEAGALWFQHRLKYQCHTKVVYKGGETTNGDLVIFT